jgi:hypothetical protein
MGTELQKTNSEKETLAKLELVLLAIAKGIGIRKKPEEADMLFMQIQEGARFIFNYYKAFTKDMNTLARAFDFAIVNGIEHYNNMDKMFIARALNTYKPQLIIQLRNDQSELDASKFVPSLEPHEECEACYEALAGYIERTKTFPIVWDWNKVYSHMLSRFDLYPELDEEQYPEMYSWNWFKQQTEIEIAKEKADISLRTNSRVDEIVINNMLSDVTKERVRTRVIKKIIKKLMYENKGYDKTGTTDAG